MKKNSVLFFCAAFTAFSVFAGGCANRRTGKTQDTTLESTSVKQENKKTMSSAQGEKSKDIPSQERVDAPYKQLDLRDKIILLWMKDNIKIRDLGEVYVMEDVCLTKSQEYEYASKMFENKKIGDTISLPNGEFVVSELKQDENSDWLEIRVDNGYFKQLFWIIGEEVTAMGAGEGLQQEAVYIGDVYVAKDAILNRDSENGERISFREVLEGKHDLMRYGTDFQLIEMDKDGIILGLEETVLP